MRTDVRNNKTLSHVMATVCGLLERYLCTSDLGLLPSIIKTIYPQSKDLYRLEMSIVKHSDIYVYSRL